MSDMGDFLGLGPVFPPRADWLDHWKSLSDLFSKTSRITDKLQSQLDAYEMEHGRSPDVLIVDGSEFDRLLKRGSDDVVMFYGIRVSTPQREYDPLRHWGIPPTRP